MAYSFVALPLMQAKEVAERIKSEVRKRLGRTVAVMIVDSDKTYSLRSYHLSPRISFVKEIRNLGPLAYIIGRLFKLKGRSTPIAVSGLNEDVNTMLDIAQIADKARGHGAGPTVWDMASRFGTSLTGVSWEMLEGIEHHPVVIIRKRAKKKGER